MKLINLINKEGIAGTFKWVGVLHDDAFSPDDFYVKLETIEVSLEKRRYFKEGSVDVWRLRKNSNGTGWHWKNKNMSMENK